MKKLLLALCMSVLAFGVANAAEGKGAEKMQERKTEIFQKMDANGDGKVTKEEFMAFSTKKAEKRFEEIDTKNQGFFTKDEFLAAKHMHMMKKGEKPAKAVPAAATPAAKK